jgi:FMN phosphatase YigB (HAD superfamily)
MIKAVLLDLDDTLLGNPTEAFVEHYLGALNDSVDQALGVPDVRRAVMMATRAMIHNLDPTRTNAEVFYDALDLPREPFDDAVQRFYESDYPRLQTYTTPRPNARALVERLLDQKYMVVVATAPVFPRVAVEQRLVWAGLPVDDVNFRLVTTLENMHYSKPLPHYYEEILAWIGVQADEAIMVGDDWNHDIKPAWLAGLNTFLVCYDNPPAVDLAQPVRPDGYGTLDDFFHLIDDHNWLEQLDPRPLEPQQIEPRLLGNVAALMGMVQQVPIYKWHLRPDPDEWTPVEVVCHLRDSERAVQRPRLETIYHEENPFLATPKPSPVPATCYCPAAGLDAALEFVRERRITLDFLAGLEPGDWHRPARHSIFGPTTLLEMANFTAQHDRLHTTQLCQTVSKCS